METYDLNELLAERLSSYVGGPGKHSQASLAKLAKISQRTVSNALTPTNRVNDKANPKPTSATLATVQACADALGVKPWELLMPTAELEQFRLFQQFKASLAPPQAAPMHAPPVASSSKARRAA